MKLLSIKGLDEDAFKAVNLRSEMTEEIAQGVLDNMETKVGPIVEVTGKNVAKQRQRLGGDWAVALAVISRSQRESLRKIFGLDLVFVVLNMTKECAIKRLRGRHGAHDDPNDAVSKLHKLYEPAGDDEESAYNINITEDMTPDDVVQKTLEIIN